LDLLKSGKRGVFLTSSSTAERMSDSYKKARYEMTKRASFIGGYRLPSKMFKESGTDVVVDMLVFEKHPDDIVKQIETKNYQDGNLKDAIELSVDILDFLEGKYFTNRPKLILGDFVSKAQYMEENPDALERYARDAVHTDLSLAEVKKMVEKKFKKNGFKNSFGYAELIPLYRNVVSEQTKKIVESIIKELENETLELRDDVEGGLKEKDFIDLYQRAKEKNINIGNLIRYKMIAIENKVSGGHLFLLELILMIMDGKVSEDDVNAFLDENREDYDILTNDKFLKSVRKSFSTREMTKDFNRLMLFLNMSGVDVKKMIEENPLYLKQFKRINDQGNTVYSQSDFTAKELESPLLSISKDGDVVSMEDSISVMNGMRYQDAILHINDMKKPDGVSDELWDMKTSHTITKLRDHKSVLSMDKLPFSPKTTQIYLQDDVDELVRQVMTMGGTDLARVFKDKVFQGLQKSSHTAVGVGVTIENIESVGNWNELFRIFLQSKSMGKPLLVSKYIHSNTDDGSAYIKGLYQTAFGEIEELLKYYTKEAVMSDVSLKSKLEEKLESSAIIKAEKVTSADDGEPMEELRGAVTDELIQMARIYQNEDARDFSTKLKDTMRQDVGLGKSITMLMTAIAAIRKGTAKRILVLTPNGVVSKLEDEFRKFMTSEWQDKLMVMRTQSFGDDFKRMVSDGNIRIVIAPHSIIPNFKLRDKTVDKLVRVKSTTGEKDYETPFYSLVGTYPNFGNAKAFFENTGVDAIFIDEQQNFKNGVFDMGLRKASHVPSQSHIALVYITEYIRNKRGGNGSGVVSVTATPWTNSPSEIVSNMVLSGGYKDANGKPKVGFRSKKDFIDNYIVSKDIVTDKVNGVGVTTSKTFTGFSNFIQLKSLVKDSVKYRTAESEQSRVSGLKVKPDSTDFSATGALRDDVNDTFNGLALANEAFKTSIHEKSIMKYADNEKTKDDLVRSLQKTVGETFGFINRVRNLSNGVSFANGICPIIVKDGTSLDDIKVALKGLRVFEFLLYKDTSKSKDALSLDDLDGLEVRDEAMNYFYDGYKDDADNILVEKGVQGLTPDFLEERDGKLYFNAYTIKDDAIRRVTEALIKKGICERENLFNVNDFPKYVDLMDNIRTEYERKEMSRQIVFSDTPVLTQRIITQIIENGVNGKILPKMTVHLFNKAGGLKSDKSNAIELQNKFNESETPDIMVFGIAGITGVDFNKNVSAAHLMNIPSTPDIHHQAKGRGVRQGNTMDNVHVYKYFTAGTFDTFMDKLMEGKSDWIEQLGDKGEGEDEIQVDTSSIEQITAMAMQMFGGKRKEDGSRYTHEEMVNMFMDFQKEEVKKEGREIGSIKIKKSIENLFSLVDMESDGDYLRGECITILRSANSFAFRQPFIWEVERLSSATAHRVDIHEMGISLEKVISTVSAFLDAVEKSTINKETNRLHKAIQMEKDMIKERSEVAESRREAKRLIGLKKTPDDVKARLTNRINGYDDAIRRLRGGVNYGNTTLRWGLNLIMESIGESYLPTKTQDLEVEEALTQTIEREFKKVRGEIDNIYSKIKNRDSLISKGRIEVLAKRGDSDFNENATIIYNYDEITISEAFDLIDDLTI